jgi:hypothetical protein
MVRDHDCEKGQGENQNRSKLSHTIILRAHRRLCPFGVRLTAIERKLRILHPMQMLKSKNEITHHKVKGKQDKGVIRVGFVFAIT